MPSTDVRRIVVLGNTSRPGVSEEAGERQRVGRPHPTTPVSRAGDGPATRNPPSRTPEGGEAVPARLSGVGACPKVLLRREAALKGFASAQYRGGVRFSRAVSWRRTYSRRIAGGVTPMGIKVSCPRCEERYTVADAQEGKTVRCKRCEVTFVVAPAAARPAGRRSTRRIARADARLGGSTIPMRKRTFARAAGPDRKASRSGCGWAAAAACC